MFLRDMHTLIDNCLPVCLLSSFKAFTVSLEYFYESFNTGSYS